jgi:hypothetical protein
VPVEEEEEEEDKPKSHISCKNNGCKSIIVNMTTVYSL